MTEITLTGCRIVPMMVPLRRSLGTSFGVFKEGPFLAVEVTTSGGAGRVVGFTFHRLGLTVVPPLIEHLVETWKGRPISFATMGVTHDAWQKSLMLLGHEGVSALAISMLDMAVHDALAQAAGVPLWRLLGGAAAPISAYNSCGLGIMSPDAAAREAVELAGENGGYAHVKMRLGRATIGDDIAAIKAVRASLPAHVALSADFNQALPAHRALAACRAIDGFGLTWIEEPVAYDDYETQAHLTAKLSTSVQIGETWWHWRIAQRAISMRASDEIMPDILRIGGVTGWMRVARSAAVAGVPMSSHLSPEYSAHVLAATPTAAWLEYMDWAQELIEAPVIPVGGVVTLPSTPGAGIAWREASIAKYRVT
jgi:mandelate racemase